MREDLVAITEEDLVAFSNRGTVNRAAKEAAADALACALDETAGGAVRAVWSDGFTVEVPAGKTLRESRCSCLAVGTCRHVVRTVLRYQRAHAATAAAARASGAWDPGAIGDDALAAHLPRAALERARALLEGDGVLAELVRSAKPLARLHGLGCHVRFRVPGDVRYAAADCSAAAAPAMVAVAVWAFRRLAPEAASGFVVLGAPAPAPAGALDAVDAAARAWFAHGLAAAPPHFGDDLRRLEAACREAGLIWPAEDVAAFADEAARYAARDALYGPERAIASVGELLARVDALRAATGAVPVALVRGTAEDRAVELGAARLVGLGCEARARRGGATLRAYFQDLDSGAVSTVGRDFADAPGGVATGAAGAAGGGGGAPEAPRPFHRLGEVAVGGGVGLGQLGLAQLGRSLLSFARAKRAASGALALGRGRVAVSPQAYAWEELREPVLVDDLEELRARLAALPPACLRPRRADEGFHVLAIAGAAADARFDVARQRVTATVRDAGGRAATIVHAYDARAAEGCELLLARLAGGARVKFVAGHVALTHAGIVVEPTAIVFEDAAGKRAAVQPTVDRDSGAGSKRAPADAQAARAGVTAVAAPAADDIGVHLADVQDALASLLQTGLRRADDVAARRLCDLARTGESLGLGRLPARVAGLAADIEAKLRDPRWDPTPAATRATDLAVLLRLAAELV